MRSLATVTALACLTGCAMTPMEMRDGGARLSVDSAKPAEQLAQCLGRNAENYSVLMAGDHFSATWRTAMTPGTWEVIVISRGVTRAVADISPTRAGSKAIISQSPYLVHGDLSEKMAAGC